jgi:hypothetical protein
MCNSGLSNFEFATREGDPNLDGGSETNSTRHLGQPPKFERPHRLSLAASLVRGWHCTFHFLFYISLLFGLVGMAPKKISWQRTVATMQAQDLARDDDFLRYVI